MKKFALVLLAAFCVSGTANGQAAAPNNTAAKRTDRPFSYTYFPTNESITVGNLTVSGLATPVIASVTPVLTKIGSVTTVAGAALVDGDYFTIEYAPGLTVPIEFDADPGNGTTGGRVPYVFKATDTADEIRDGLITLLNAAAPTQLTASSGGAATISLVLKTPGAVGGTNTENVANAGFAVTGFVDPTHVTTYGYKAVAYLPDGTSTAASAEVTTATGHATLSASNYNTVTWGAVPRSSSIRLYRTTGGAAPPKLIYTGTALSFNDIGAAGTAQVPSATNTTGIIVGGVTPGGSNTQVQFNNGGAFGGDAGLTYDAATQTVTTPTVGARNLTATALATPGSITVAPQGTGGAVTWTYKLVARLADGTTTQAGAASSTAAGNATLDGTNFNRLTWSAVTGAVSYDIYRTVVGTTPATTGKIVSATTALTADDTALAGGGETAPTTNGTGRLTSSALTANRVALIGTGGQIEDSASVEWVPSAKAFAFHSSLPGTLAPTSAIGQMITTNGWMLASGDVNWSDPNAVPRSPAAPATPIAGMTATGEPYMIGCVPDIDGPCISIRTGETGSNPSAISLIDAVAGRTYWLTSKGRAMLGAGPNRANIDTSYYRSAGGVISFGDGGENANGGIKLAGVDSAGPLAIYSASGYPIRLTPEHNVNGFELWPTTLRPIANDAGDFGDATNRARAVYVNRGVFGSKTKVLTDASATDFATIPLADGAMTAGEILYRVTATIAAQKQVIAGRIRYTAIRDNTDYDCDVSEVGTQTNSQKSGTLTGAITCSAAAGLLTFSANFDSSLTAPTVTLYYRFDSTDTIAVTPL